MAVPASHDLLFFHHSSSAFFSLFEHYNEQSVNITRSSKDRQEQDHQGIAEGTAAPEQHLPRYFAKHGHAGEEPNKYKKGGAGKANWGKSGDEIVDESFNLNNARRRSNSSIENAKSFKSKFETVDPEPVFEEEVHGDGGVNHFDADAQGGASEGENLELDKQSSSDSAESIASVEVDSATANKA